MDSRGFKAGEDRISVWHDNRAWVSDTLAGQPFYEKGLIHIESGVRLAINYGLNRVRFPAPLRPGCKIRARVGLLAYKELPDSIEATFSITIEGEQPGKPNCVAEWIVRYYS